MVTWTKNGWGGERAYWCFRGKFSARAVFPLGEGSAWVLFSAGKIYTGILFPGAILSRDGFSGGKFYAGGNSMLQRRITHISNNTKNFYFASSFFTDIVDILFIYLRNSFVGHCSLKSITISLLKCTFWLVQDIRSLRLPKICNRIAIKRYQSPPLSYLVSIKCNLFCYALNICHLGYIRK